MPVILVFHILLLTSKNELLPDDNVPTHGFNQR